MRTKIKIFAVLAVISLLTLSCSTQRQTVRTLQGAAIGTVPGLIMKNPYVAVAGTLLGGTIGSLIGLAEDEHGGSITGVQTITPLPWIRGERTAVFIDNNHWGESLRAVIEERLRGYGAVIVTTPGRRYNQRPEDLAAAVYVTEVFTECYGNYAIVQIRIIDKTSDILKASGSGRAEVYNSYYYGSGGDYRSFEWAANRALANLH